MGKEKHFVSMLLLACTYTAKEEKHERVDYLISMIIIRGCDQTENYSSLNLFYIRYKIPVPWFWWIYLLIYKKNAPKSEDTTPTKPTVS